MREQMKSPRHRPRGLPGHIIDLGHIARAAMRRHLAQDGRDPGRSVWLSLFIEVTDRDCDVCGKPIHRVEATDFANAEIEICATCLGHNGIAGRA
jgi:hypothetical protein